MRCCRLWELRNPRQLTARQGHDRLYCSGTAEEIFTNTFKGTHPVNHDLHRGLKTKDKWPTQRFTLCYLVLETVPCVKLCFIVAYCFQTLQWQYQVIEAIHLLSLGCISRNLSDLDNAKNKDCFNLCLKVEHPLLCIIQVKYSWAWWEDTWLLSIALSAACSPYESSIDVTEAKGWAISISSILWAPLIWILAWPASGNSLTRAQSTYIYISVWVHLASLCYYKISMTFISTQSLDALDWLHSLELHSHHVRGWQQGRHCILHAYLQDRKDHFQGFPGKVILP